MTTSMMEMVAHLHASLKQVGHVTELYLSLYVPRFAEMDLELVKKHVTMVTFVMMMDAVRHVMNSTPLTLNATPRLTTIFSLICLLIYKLIYTTLCARL